MRKRLLFGVPVILAIGAVIAITATPPTDRAPWHVVYAPNKPVTLSFVSINAVYSPTFRSRSHTWTHFRRPDGSFGHELRLSGDGLVTDVSRNIWLADSTFIFAQDTKGLKTTYPGRLQRWPSVYLPGEPRESCNEPNGTLVGTDQIAGVSAQKFEMNRYKDKDGKLVKTDRKLTVWVAPSLGCMTVRQHMEFYDEKTGDLKEVEDKNLISIEHKSPAARFFDVDHLNEAKPSAASGKCPASDQMYDALHKRKKG